LFYKVGKKTFEILKNLTNLTRVVLVFFTFFMILYWIFQLADTTFFAGFTPFFNSVKDFVHIFYTRTSTVENVTLDFSFLVLGFFLLIVSWLLKFVVEFIETIERKYDSIYKNLKNKTEEVFNFNLEQNYHNVEHKNNNFALLIKFSARNMAKDNFYDYNVSDGTEEKQKEVLDEFLNNMSKTLGFQKKVFGDGVILSFNKVKNLDKILLEITQNVDKIRDWNMDANWDVSYLMAIETYADEKDFMDRCRTLIMLIKLNLKNEILCLSTFKQRYSLVQNQQFFIESKGVYTIHAEEDVFCVKNKAKSIKQV